MAEAQEQLLHLRHQQEQLEKQKAELNLQQHLSMEFLNPKDRDTFIGPMISEGEATRLKGWIDEAVEAGATLLCGGWNASRPLPPSNRRIPT